MTFTTTPLINGGYLVEGQDSKGNEGTTILLSDRWDMVQHLRAHGTAQEVFDQAVQEFFQPLTEAAEAASAVLRGPTQDWGRVTLGEAVQGHEEEVIQLDTDGILLRLLAEGRHDLLRWVGGDTLVAISQ